VCEAAGVPSASLVSEGFMTLASAASIGLGMANLPVALVPGHPGVQSKEELRRNILEVTLDRVVDNLLSQPEGVKLDNEPGARDIIVRGSLEKIDEYFLAHELSDGLPIRPPTREAIEAFLRHTDRDPDEVLGVPLPDARAATVWSVAVNGVMAGCRPEYMPILVALIEAMCDPYYGVEHSGSTPGGEVLIMLNGPLIKELGFNYRQGVMRDGIQANTAIGRFWRLYMRNIVGFLHHRNDKGTFGHTWRVVVAENEDVLAKIGWEPNCVDMGYPAGSNVLTIARYTGGNHIGSVSGDTPQQMMPYLADAMVSQHSWHQCFTVGALGGTLRPLVMLSPILAETMAAAGWTKRDFKQALHAQARIPAVEMERMLRDWTYKYPWDIIEEVRLGHLPAQYRESDDPNRLVPIVWDAEDYMVLVTGDEMRNSAYILAHQGSLGYPVAREIRLPKHWQALRAEDEAKRRSLLAGG
jgi:hypothetical protein